jgi:hypothetical protein
VGAKRSLKSNAVALAEVCKANDERTFARMRGNDVDAPEADLRISWGAEHPWWPDPELYIKAQTRNHGSAIGQAPEE